MTNDFSKKGSVRLSTILWNGGWAFLPVGFAKGYDFTVGFRPASHRAALRWPIPLAPPNQGSVHQLAYGFGNINCWVLPKFRFVMPVTSALPLL
jgi:hypothetical protein